MTTNQLNQLQLSYSNIEDRMILRINSTTNEEIGLFITRRIIVGFWPGAIQILNKSILNKAPEPEKEESNPIIKQAKLDFKHQKSISKQDFSTPFAAGKEFPLGESPILVTAIKLSLLSDNKISITFTTSLGKDITTKMNEEMLHCLCNLIIQISPATEWNLNLDGLEMSSNETDTSANTRQLH